MTIAEAARLVRPASSTTSTRDRLRRVLLVVLLLDAVVIATAIWSAWQLRAHVDLWLWEATEQPIAEFWWRDAAWIFSVWILWLTVRGAYSPRHFGTGPEEFKVVALASVLSLGTVGLICYLLNNELSRGFVVLSAVIALPTLLAERYGARKLIHRRRARGFLLHRVIAVGGPSTVRELVEVLDRERYVGYQVVGACVPSEISVDEGNLSVPVLGVPADAVEVSRELGADTILVTGGGYSSATDLRRIAWDLGSTDIDLVVVPSLTDVAGPRVHVRPVAGLPLMHIEPPQTDEAGGWSKRAFDIAGALFVIILAAPLLLLVAVVVKLEDGGQVFFRQVRVGRGGDRIHMWKFRSMVQDAERRLDEVRHLNESDGLLFKSRTDPRVTRVGNFLRRYSLDEIPQLFNVLVGEMSLVGPRPPLPTEVAMYGDDVRRRLLVRPGMTGLWQVSGRSELNWTESVRLDLYYVDNWSMMSDLVILAKTVRAVIRSHGAY